MSTYPWIAHYEAGVPPTLTIPEMSVRDLLTEAAERYPNRTALHMVLKYLPLGIKIRSTYTYREVNEASDRFAAGLAELGVRKGDRVSIMLPNLPQGVIAFFGILKAGGVVVNTNPTYTPRELQHQLHDSGATTIIMLSGLYDRLKQIQEKTDVSHVIIADVPDSLGWPFNKLVAKQVRASGLMKEMPTGPGIHHFRDLLQSSAAVPNVETGQDEVVLFQYTGGTTGLAKAAQLTNRNLVSNVHQVLAWFANIRPGEEKLLAAIPFFHVYGMTVAMLFAAKSGAEMYIMPDPRNIEMVMEIIHREKITVYPGVPAMYVAINNHPKVSQYDLHSIRACLSGASALPIEVANRFEELTGGRLVEGFGMTECAPVASANPLNGERRIGTVGLPLPNTEMSVVSLTPDADGKYTHLAQGEEGELVVRGPQVMKGYWNQPEDSNATVDEDGWLHTGDIGSMDEDGYFKIVDRKKDLIIASGYNIVPREVEEVLFTHEKVQEATVAGLPDARRGETVKAYIVLKQGQTCDVDEIRNFCKQHLAPYKVPTLVEFLAELPKSQAGKVLRRVLVEEDKKKMKI